MAVCGTQNNRPRRKSQTSSVKNGSVLYAERHTSSCVVYVIVPLEEQAEVAAAEALLADRWSHVRQRGSAEIVNTARARHFSHATPNHTLDCTTALVRARSQAGRTRSENSGF